MEEIGKVVDTSGKFARVEIEPKGSCKNCAARVFCSPSGDKMCVETINRHGVKIGDTVKVETSANVTLLAAFLLFILPLVLFGIGFVLLRQLTRSENWAAAGGLLLLVMYLLCLKPINRRVAKTAIFKPVIKEIVEESDNEHKNTGI